MGVWRKGWESVGGECGEGVGKCVGGEMKCKCVEECGVGVEKCVGV